MNSPRKVLTKTGWVWYRQDDGKYWTLGCKKHRTLAYLLKKYGIEAVR